MVRVHRSGRKFESFPSRSIKCRRRRFATSAALMSFLDGAVKYPPPAQYWANLEIVVNNHGPVTVVEVPTLVFICVLDALKLIKSLETNPNDEDRHHLEFAVNKIHHVAATFYTQYLPRNWKFDPATATQFVWLKVSDDELEGDNAPISVQEKSEHAMHYHSRNPIDPNIKLPEIYHVSLNKKQSELWLKFKKSDKKTIGLDLGSLEKTAKPIKVNHPYARFIGAFAVDGFNKAFEMHVKKDIQKYLEQYEITECSYHKMSSNYWFHMTIKATEEGISGVYESKVEIATDDGQITLCRFIRIDEIEEGKGAKAMTQSKTREDGWSDPEGYYFTGLVCRTNRKGYDFYNPFGIDRHWRLHG